MSGSSGGLVHLPEDHGHLVDDARLVHLAEELRALTRAVADAAEGGVATVLGGDVADELLDDDGLARAGAAEHGRLATLEERADEVNDLHARLEDLGRRRLVGEEGRGAGDRVAAGRPCPPASPRWLRHQHLYAAPWVQCRPGA